MAIQVQLRRGTATQNNAFTGAIGELSFDTTNNQLRVHDGSTAGGFKIGTGDFPTGTANVALGNTALDDLDSGSPGGNNVAVGHNALTANTTASNNVAVGSGSLAANTTGATNVAVGNSALAANTTAGNNVAVGSAALATSTTATDNTAIGYQALNANTSGADNVALGAEAGHDITTGSRNTILGSKAADAATTTDDSTLIGYNAGGSSIMTGHDNTAVGANTLGATTSGQQNTAVGKNAGTSISTGNYNTLLGFQAGDAISTGSSNVAIGYNALSAEDGNGSNVAIGANALGNLNAGANAENVAIGHDAGASATTGGESVFVGATAGDAITIGEKNVAIGHNALGADTVGSRNVAVGWDALGSQVAAGGSINNYYNTVMGANSGFTLNGGYYNTFVGGLCGDGTDDGLNNVAMGFSALRGNAGNSNTAIGVNAASGATGSENTCIGGESGYSLTDGSQNTFLGYGAGYHVQGGNDNTVVGKFNGNQDNTDIRNTNDQIAISNGDGNVRIFCNSEGYVKHKPINSIYYSMGGAYHEFSHNNNDTSLIIYHQQHASFAAAVEFTQAQRTASSYYSFEEYRSGAGSDIEFYLRGDGNAYADGSWNGGGADYAEYFEWADGNSSNQDRTGYTVVLDNEKIRLATSDDAAANIIGAVSVNPSMVGDADIDQWKHKYQRDEFGGFVWETYTVTEWTETVVDQEAADEVLDDDGDVVTPALNEITREVFHSYETDKIPDGVTAPDDATVSTEDANGNTLKRKVLNSDYNPDAAYVSREDRQEWATIGLMGKLRIRAGQPTGDRWIKMRDISDTVEEWLVR